MTMFVSDCNNSSGHFKLNDVIDNVKNEQHLITNNVCMKYEHNKKAVDVIGSICNVSLNRIES